MNHRQQIIHSVRGFSLHGNNKTAVKFDQFMNDICNGKLYQNNIFILFERNEDNSINEVIYRRA